MVGNFMIGQDKRRKREITRHTIKFFEKLLRASSDGIVITDAAHNIIVVNEAFCDFFGQQHREIIETNLFFWLEQLDANSIKCWTEMENRVHSEGSCHDVEFTLMTHAGIKYLSVNASLMEKVGTEESGIIISIWRDITKQKQIEEELKILNKSLEQRVIEKTSALIKSNEELRAKIAELKLSQEALRMSESKYRLLLENLPQRIFYKNKDLMYVSCNENFARDLHIKPDEIKGKTDYDLFPRKLAEKYRADDKRILESGQTEEIEEKYVKDGQEYIINTVKTPIKGEKGTIIGILGIFWDITEKIAMERESVRSRHLVSLGELAASVAHEVNNPITGVINYAQILCNKSNEGSREKDIANRIIREGDRIASIVQSLLSFARVGDRKDKKSIINIKEILSDMLILTKAQLRQEGIRIKLDIPQRLSEIVADPQQIQQVFLNAINNARYALNQKYPGAHDNKILEVLGEEVPINNHPYVKIIFYDHGTGIPAQIRGKIMDPFFTTKPRGKGTGLGLSISQGIVKDHGGKLTIESVEGEFTKVAIILPIMVQN